MPLHIALARFWESAGLQGILSNYPYWYLGSTPYRWLTGPILPFFLSSLHRLLPAFSLFEIFYLLTFFAWCVSSVGVYFLVLALGSSRQTAFMAAFFYFFGPLVPLTFGFSDGLYLLASSLIPYILLVYLKNKSLLFFAVLTFAFLLDIKILPVVLLGLAAILITGNFKQFGRTIKTVVASLLVVTLWYTPGFWWQVIFSASFAGKPFYQVFFQITKLLPLALAIGLAVLAKNIGKKNILARFTVSWLVVFGFVTLLRFIADPDFWLDWIGYTPQLQLGISIGLAILISKRKNILYLIFIFTFYFLIFYIVFDRHVMQTIRPDITGEVEYRIGEWLSQNIDKDQSVFLSGSTVFWLNAFFDVVQVRGGNDPVSRGSQWASVAWQIREGELEGMAGLEKMGVDYLVIHSATSQEYYHDFSYDRYENFGLKKVYDKNGDRIYKW